MDETTKKAIKKTILALRKLLERQDIPSVLKQYGIFPDGRRVPIDKLVLLDDNGKKRRERLEAIINREVQAVGGDRKAGVERYCREVAFTYLNRLIALRSMEVRGLLDECIKIREDYAGRSLRHHRFLKEKPGIQFDAEDTDSFKAFLCAVFRELQDDIKILFDPDDEYSIIMPSIQALRECIRSLNEDIPEDAFKEPELIGWVYQYFQTEEKERVFEEVRTKKKKIEGDDIVPATSLYTELYMVDYLVQNSLGAIWMEMYPDSRLYENWPYFVKNQDLKPREPRPVKSLTFLDPASGSGHFHLVAFDLLVQMYEEETRLAAEGKIPKEWVVPKEKIATTILESNLHGIDIDLRSVQLSYLVLYLRMREHQKSVGVPKSLPGKVNLVAADASLLNTPEFLSWCEGRFKEEPYAFNIVKGIVGRLRNLSEIGSLARPEEDLKDLIHKEKERLLSAWKKEKTPQQIPLFRKFLTPEQQELPFEKITDDQFWEGVLSRVTKALDEYYKDASERGDTKAQVFAHEASRGFKLLELFNKRYDVVATNPPYLGSKKMGNILKSFVIGSYSFSKSDLFTAFIERCNMLADRNGAISMITRTSWTNLRSFGGLRKVLNKDSTLRSFLELGSNAFSTPMHVGVNCALFIWRRIPCLSTSVLAYWTVSQFYTPYEKEKKILSLVQDENSVTWRKHAEFLSLDGAPLLLALPPRLITMLSRSKKISSIAKVNDGMTTGDNDRFVRFTWEVQVGERWRYYVKGGGYHRWFGNERFVVDWEREGFRIKKHPKSFVRNEDRYFQPGLTYSLLSAGCLSVRLLRNAAFDPGGISVFPTRIENIPYLAAILNSRLISFVLRGLAQGPRFNGGYVGSLPLPEIYDNSIQFLGHFCLEVSQILSTSDITERSFDKNTLISSGNSFLKKYLTVQSQDFSITALLITGEYLIEEKLLKVYGITSEERKLIWEQTNLPAGYYRLIEGNDVIPETIKSEIPKELIEHIEKHNRIKPSEEELSKIKSGLRALYEAGPGAKIEDVVEEEADSDDEEETESLIGKKIPIPTETFLEELSVKMEIHPISIYWLLKEMREKEGIVCWPESKRYVEDYFTVMMLRMLGFQWPKQVEANEPIPDWADKDGIIPITEHTEEKVLLERIRDRIGAKFGENKISDIESEFADILYNAACKEAEIRGRTPPKKKVTLAQWLEKEFSKRHTSQFKKRPIAWHLTSSNGTFQVLIFCHKISLDIFKNLKNRHFARVQSYYGSLLEKARKGESVPGGLTAGKLSDIEYELEEFSNKLDKLIAMPYEPLIDDGVRVNIAPLQKLGLLASPVLAAKDIDRAIADRNRWREDDKEQTTIWKLS